MAETILPPALIREKVAQYIRSRAYLNVYRCQCGNEFITTGQNIEKRTTKTCGCRRITHGMSCHPLYEIYIGMRSRCFNKNCTGYWNYGGRGIIVCKEWLDDRTAFFEWAFENGWEKGLTIDRIDNNGNYDPKNCRFVTQAINNKNRRNSKNHASQSTAKEI